MKNMFIQQFCENVRRVLRGLSIDYTNLLQLHLLFNEMKFRRYVLRYIVIHISIHLFDGRLIVFVYDSWIVLWET